MISNHKANSEDGAILIFVAIIITVMMGMAAFVIDQGMFYFARGQAQNAADAAALAAATSLVYDDASDLSPSGPAYRAGMALGAANLVLGQAPGVDMYLGDGTGFAHPAPASCSFGGCAQADVYRDGTHGSTSWATYFANIFGVSTQGTKATATAQVVAANASKCLRPWMIPDKWEEHSTPANTQFDPGVDVYIPPVPGPGTGFTPAMDLGTPVVFKEGNPSLTVSPGEYYEADLTGGGGGTSEYRDAITGCANVEKAIGQLLQIQPGNRPTPTRNAVNDLIATDSSAHWDGTQVVNNYGPDSRSPRIVPVALFSPQEWATNARTTGTFDMTIVNILSFFIVDVDSMGNVNAVIVGSVGDMVAGAGPAPTGPGFLRFVSLIR